MQLAESIGENYDSEYNNNIIISSKDIHLQLPQSAQSFAMSSKFTNRRKIVIAVSFVSIASLLWISYKFKQKKDKTSYHIVDIKTRRDLCQQTAKLLDSEWKDSSQKYPILSTESKQNGDEADGDIPCNRILIKTSPISIFKLDTMIETVIGHVYLKESYRDITLAKLSKMLKVGLPVNAIKERAKHGGIDLNDPMFYDQDGNLTFENVSIDEERQTREIYIG